MSAHPLARTTVSMQGPSPIEPIRIQFAVMLFAGWSMRRRMAAGSSWRCSAILSSCTSTAKRGCGVPCPRLGPQGGLFVKARSPRKRYAGISYVTVCSAPV